VGGQHRLVVLDLVLCDHAERERVGAQRLAERAGPPARPGPVDQVEHPAADLAGVPARLLRREQREGGPLRPRVLERVVDRVDLRVQRVAAADLAQQPQLLLVGDVGQVPDQR
jgi:hypothetical protein